MTEDLTRVPDAERCVLRPLLERHAAQQPDRVFAKFADGSEWTYAEMLVRARRLAAGLARLGIGKGDRVVAWLPNGPRQLETWFGINYLGAIFVPVNLAYKGNLLAHVIRNSGAKVAIVHEELAPRLADVDRAKLETLVVPGDLPGIAGMTEMPFDDFPGDGSSLPDLEPVAPWDTQMIIYTSGTTGPSKGVLCSYAHTFATGNALRYVTSEDRELVALPLFHVGGASLAHEMLVKGGSIAVVEAFDTRAFWKMVRDTQSTSITLLGVMAPFLLKEPPGPADKDHTLRTVLMIPLSESAGEFAERFGVQIFTAFNMTEISTPLVSDIAPQVPGSCGRLRPGVEARVVDENDCEVPHGDVGELVLRTASPWAMNHGYNNDPEATARAWRNGWFHTGDGFRRDAAGNFFFVDRMKDAIRRRGENISSFEVELEVTEHPFVRECAAVAVANEFSEDEVMVVVSLVEGRTLDCADLIEFLVPRMPHFMVPRYVRVVPALPRTPTQKVQKYQLRNEGVTPDTWDREKAGIKIKRQKLKA